MITCFFNAAYVNADIERYYLGPALIAWTWLAILARAAVDLAATALGAAMGAGDDAGATRRRDDAPGSSRGVGLVVAAVLLLAPTAADFGGPRGGRRPTTGDVGAAEWLDEVLAEVEPDAMIVSWWSYSTPLWYAQLIEDRRPDIFVVDDRTRLDLQPRRPRPP